jgi:cytochrome P450
MDLLTKEVWDDNWREMLDSLRPHRFVKSNNYKVGNYVNVMQYDDVMFIEQNMNTMFSAADLNFFEGTNSLPAMTSMDGQNHKQRKVPMKNFLMKPSNLDTIVDDFFEKSGDEYDAHSELSVKIVMEILDQYMGIEKKYTDMIVEQLVHFANGRQDKLMPIYTLFSDLYDNAIGLTEVTKQASNDKDEFIGNMFLLISGFFTLGAGIELCHMYGDKLKPDSDDRFFKEVIRHFSPFTHALRRSLVDWNGFPAGTIFAIWFNSANLDPKKFDNPHQFNPYRDNLNNHFGFGFGHHRCIGRHISNTVMSRLVQKMRDFYWEVYDYNINRYPVVFVQDLWVSRSKR